MKGSPIIATAITIVVLLGIYLGIRAVVLPDGGATSSGGHGHSHDHGDHSHDHGDHGHDHGAHGHDHGSHDHGGHGGHDDTALETEFELYFSSPPQSLKITQPSTKKEILNVSEFNGPEWTGSGVLNLQGHSVELQVEVTWETPNSMNFVQVIVHPDAHATREKTLRNDDNISDIAEFNW